MSAPEPVPAPIEPVEDLSEDMDDGVDYWKEFQLGTRSIFKKWTAMRMAVTQEWGGRDSAQKEEDLIVSIFDLLDTKPDIDRLLDLIEYFLPDQFSMILEDNSAEQVGNDVWDVYCTCADGDTTIARKYFNTLAEDIQREITDLVGLTECEDVPMLDEVKIKPAKKEKVVDDDGWEVVAPKNKKKNKK